MKQILLTLLCSLAIVACHNADDLDPVITDSMVDVPDNIPIIGVVTRAGTFKSYEHGLMGNALVYVDSTKTTFLRLEQFSMSQGPDVRVYLSKSNNYSKANVVEIGRLTEGYNNQVFDIEVMSSSYSEQHKFVLVYCLQYNSLFGYAELK